MEKFKAVVVAKIVELRLPFAGKVSWVGVSVGSKVKKGQELIRLDTRVLGKRLDKENKDYLKKRAMFEQIKRRYKQSDDSDKKYILDRSQADLDAAVLAVELSKLELEKAVLKAPKEGIICDDGNLVAGQNITPSSYVLRMIIDGTMQISAKLPQDKFDMVKPEDYAEFIPTAFPGKTYKGRVLNISPIPPDGRSSDFGLSVVLEKTKRLRPGMRGMLMTYKDR